MIHRNMMLPQKAIIALSLVVLIGIVFTLHILPQKIAWGFACVGRKLDSSDLGTKYESLPFYSIAAICNFLLRKDVSL